ncbi:MAG: Ig-like domain-containing protein [Clostridia bacterium]|nr:Ig-like domain-containing protein [Clostridia bacterium]
MKKFSMILFVVTILAVCLVGATAFASSLVETEENIYIGEYAHDNQNESDRNVVIVYGTASTDEQAGITERGIVLSDGTEYRYYRAWRWDAETGKFGVAIIRKTVEKGDYTARAYAKVGGTYDETEKIVLGYIDIDVGDAVSLKFDTTLAKTQDEITVTSAQSVDIKDYITVADGTVELLEYSVSAENGEITVDDDGIVSYGNKAGRYTVTATHMLSNESVSINVIAYDEVYEVTTSSQLASLGNERANSYVKLMNDVEITSTDMVEDGGYAYVIGGEFNGIFDGQNNKITYDFDYTEKDMLFRGLFRVVNGDVKNLQVKATAIQKQDYGYYFSDSLGANALIENCYVDITLKQTNSGNADGSNQNWTSTQFVIGSTSVARIENCIFNMRSAIQEETEYLRGIGLQRYGEGYWTNVAYIAPDFVNPWVGGLYAAKMSDSQLNNVVWYKNTVAMMLNNGKLFDSKDGSYTFAAITEAQTMGSAWTIDRTEFNESIKLNGKDVWKTTVSEVTDKADFISKMNAATEQTVLKLTQDLLFTTNDFVKEDNGSTGTRNKDVYLIKSFKGALDGNGHKITWGLVPENVSNSSVCDSSVKGLIYNLESTARLVGCNFQGVTHVPYDSATAFIENVFGTIDRCFIDSSIVMHNGNHYLNATGTFGKHAGVIKNSVIKSSGYTGGVATGTDKGAKIIHTGQSGSNGIFENIAFIQGTKRIGTKNNGNSNGYISTDQLVNFVYYPSFEALIKGEGEQVRNDNTDDTFEYTTITETQDIGTAWTIDETGIKLNGNYVWQDTTVTTDVSDLSLLPNISAPVTITASIDGVKSSEVSFISDNTSVATVSADGVVSAVSAGTAKIYVFDVFGHYTTVSVKVFAKQQAITSKEEFLAIGELDADTYAYLTTDITLTQEDAISITSGSTTIGSFVQELKATLDGNGQKITFAYASPVSTTRFGGLFYTVSGKIKNLVIDADISAVPNYAYVVSTEFKKTGILENSFIESNVALGTATTDSRVAIIGSHYGAVKNTIISSIVTKGSTTYGMALQLYATSTPRGTWTNVALACPKTTASYTNRGGSKKITGADLNNVVRYTSLDNVIAGVGKLYSTTKDDSGAWTQTELNTAITEAQSLGSAWTIDATGIKLNGNYVYTVA